MSTENAQTPPTDAEDVQFPSELADTLNEQATARDTEMAALQDRVSHLEAKLAEARDGMLRAVADLQNVRRRSAQESIQARETAAGEVAAKLLPVLDNFERTLAAAEAGASLESVLNGVTLVDRQIREALEQHHVRPIAALGHPFDPNLHEAVIDEHSPHPVGTVIGELEKGYLIGDRVLRAAKVKVSKGDTE